MNRRDFLLATGAIALAPAARAAAATAKADHTLRITKASLEVAPGRVVQTTGYNGGVPGPLIRLKQGVPVSIDLINETSAPEFVHFHGLAASVIVDGSEEEGSPVLAPGAQRRITFTPNQAGNRWYHTHTMAMDDVSRGGYSGQYGFLYIEPKNDPGRHDQEVFLAARHWEPKIVHRPEPPNMDWTVTYGIASLGERALGHGEPIRVKEGQRVLFHLLNASATRQVNLALAGHKMQVIALDGNPVPRSQMVDGLSLAVAERADVIVEMNNPGVWILGGPRDQDRADGLGIVVEYAGKSGDPQFKALQLPPWDYTQFMDATPRTVAAPDGMFEIEFHMMPDEGKPFNRWMMNGKMFPNIDPIKVKKGKRYRLLLHNGHEDGHPMHFHRHVFEVVKFAGKPVSGMVKDTINVPRDQVVEVEFVADNPGASLLHCHMQQHMDYGLKTLITYA